MRLIIAHGGDGDPRRREWSTTTLIAIMIHEAAWRQALSWPTDELRHLARDARYQLSAYYPHLLDLDVIDCDQAVRS